MTAAPARLVIRNARVAGFAPGPKRRADLDALPVIPRADVTIEDGRIKSIREVKPNTRRAPIDPADPATIDADGRVLIPGLVDCHTHLCWAGQRLDEWEAKRRGVPYLEILKRGGGIMATVRAVREASIESLAADLLARARLMLANGSTTIEVKSGYGLTTDAELKMLRAVRLAQQSFPGTLVPTALLGHAIDDAQPGFVGVTVRQTLPAVAAEFPGITVDAFCEQGAWSLEQCVLLFNRARELGLPIRIHADQFNSLGAVPAALRLDARSIDHLEASTREDLALLAAAPNTAGVMLPACGFHLDGRYARGRRFVQDGGLLAIATNCNPGSAPCFSMPLVIALAVRHLGLSFPEAFAAATVNPAHVLGLRDRGAIAPGLRADLLLLRHTDERALAFEFGASPVDIAICNGAVAWRAH
ncbi:MAG: imidazolonepropionase [Phycisphaeraceae bacterium]|nr:imidazolonepropionase [Phycisphaeraceae bacterium]